MELTPYLFWNIFITWLQYFTVFDRMHEAKKIDILLNKTHEEMARQYVTKQELKADVLITRIDKLGVTNSLKSSKIYM